MCLLKSHRRWKLSRRNCAFRVLLAFTLSVAIGSARARSTQGELSQSPSGTIQVVAPVLDQQKEPRPLAGIPVELRGSSQDLKLLATLTDSTGECECPQWRAANNTLRVSQR